MAEHQPPETCIHLTMLLANMQALVDAARGGAELVTCGLFISTGPEVADGMRQLAVAMQHELDAYISTHSAEGFVLPEVDALSLIKKVR